MVILKVFQQSYVYFLKKKKKKITYRSLFLFSYFAKGLELKRVVLIQAGHLHVFFFLLDKVYRQFFP